ncbi:MAG: zinc finger domain-containing protein [Dehalococcoidia bacterium]
MGDSIHQKHREHLRVHGRKNEQCPRCGSKITEIRTNRRETSYCRKCQPGLLINN